MIFNIRRRNDLENPLETAFCNHDNPIQHPFSRWNLLVVAKSTAGFMAIGFGSAWRRMVAF
jgi:hypothetical protein